MVRLLQVNMNKSLASHDVIMEIVRKRVVDLVVVSEPNVRKMQDESWLHDATYSTAVCSFNSNIPIVRHGAGLGHVWLETADILVCSVYGSPNVELGVFEETLDELSRLRNAVCKDVFICGDFNAKNAACGDGVTDRRGLLLKEVMAGLGLICLNDVYEEIAYDD
ncbi:uncharacterized protein LOC142317623 [Lycorma delicatula]|uniref:uncharacterized protein LOC142317623 n=1 Tax=Lycorma delicatula TaxID=130591 RepID=UPI003F510033